MKVKQTRQVSAKYELLLEEGETFDFEIVFDRDEWVLQGADLSMDGDNPEVRGIRYSQAELSAILKVLREMNSKVKK